MFRISENTLEIAMDKADFGVILGINFSDINGTDIKFKIYNEEGTLVEKTFENINNNRIELKLTQEESNKLVEGTYNYDIYQYKEGVLKNTLLKEKVFIVE